MKVNHRYLIIIVMCNKYIHACTQVITYTSVTHCTKYINLLTQVDHCTEGKMWDDLPRCRRVFHRTLWPPPLWRYPKSVCKGIIREDARCQR